MSRPARRQKRCTCIDTTSQTLSPCFDSLRDDGDRVGCWQQPNQNSCASCCCSSTVITITISNGKEKSCLDRLICHKKNRKRFRSLFDGSSCGRFPSDNIDKNNNYRIQLSSSSSSLDDIIFLRVFFKEREREKHG